MYINVIAISQGTFVIFVKKKIEIFDDIFFFFSAYTPFPKKVLILILICTHDLLNPHCMTNVKQ